MSLADMAGVAAVLLPFKYVSAQSLVVNQRVSSCTWFDFALDLILGFHVMSHTL